MVGAGVGVGVGVGVRLRAGGCGVGVSTRGAELAVPGFLEGEAGFPPGFLCATLSCHGCSRVDVAVSAVGLSWECWRVMGDLV